MNSIFYELLKFDEFMEILNWKMISNLIKSKNSVVPHSTQGLILWRPATHGARQDMGPRWAAPTSLAQW
jgi:hypothetical protein